MSEPFVAEVRIFAGNFAPRGWAFCNGQLLPIAQNTALFSLIGTTYGGDGRTTTALPNLQDRVPMHPGRGPGLSNRRLGEKGGADTVTLTNGQIPSHTHTMRGVSNAPNVSPPSGARLAAAPMYEAGDSGGLGPMASAAMSINTGGGQPHNNLQPYLGLYFIIALVGVYPSRS
jgi:microcystin-dependent protein